MRKYLAFYENEWPANIAELTAIENKPFVGYLKGEGVLFTVISEPVTGPADNEIWYTTTDGEIYDLDSIIAMLTSEEGVTYNGPTLISNEFDDEKQMFVMKFNDNVTVLSMNTNTGEIDGPLFVQSNIETIILPNSVTQIGYPAFLESSSLTSITIPNSVTSIGDDAFNRCYSLTSVTIGNSVKSIGSGAFDDCKSLTSINIPNSVTSIGGNAFHNCFSLTSITIPNSVTSIGVWAFMYCTSLASITFQGTIEQWNAISKGDYWNGDVLATYVQCSDGQVTL